MHFEPAPTGSPTTNAPTASSVGAGFKPARAPIASSERQRDNPDDHRAGGDQAPRGVSLGEQARAHDGPDQDGDLTRGGHVAHRGEDEGGEDQDVGERAEDSHPEDLGLVGAVVTIVVAQLCSRGGIISALTACLSQMV